MRRIFKIFSFVLTMLLAGNMTAQVEGVSYALSFNASTSSYDCFLIIDEGETFSKMHRIQFYSQVSIVAPTGSNLVVSNSYMPFGGNNTKKSRNSVEWLIADIVSSPIEDSIHDYYSISPNIYQTTFYDNISEGDKLRLFSVKAISNENEIVNIRLYENGVGKEIKDIDFSNGFSLGGSNQIFKGIKRENEEVSMYVQHEND